MTENDSDDSATAYTAEGEEVIAFDGGDYAPASECDVFSVFFWKAMCHACTFVCTWVTDVSAPSARSHDAHKEKQEVEMTATSSKISQKRRKLMKPVLGVSQLPLLWSEASMIVTNKKRAKELTQVTQCVSLVNMLSRLWMSYNWAREQIKKGA